MFRCNIEEPLLPHRLSTSLSLPLDSYRFMPGNGLSPTNASHGKGTRSRNKMAKSMEVHASQSSLPCLSLKLLFSPSLQINDVNAAQPDHSEEPLHVADGEKEVYKELQEYPENSKDSFKPSRSA